jgi:AcrR family transcriptional regulator
MAARKRGLSAEDVVEAAVEIADAEGLEGVTLAAVAQELGIRSPSLYAHVDGLAGLRRLLAFRAAAELGGILRRAVQGKQGAEALRALMHAYRGFARRRQGLYAAAQQAVRPGEDEELYRALAGVIEPVLQALTEAGVASEDLIHLTRALRSALHGFVELEHSSGFGMPESVDESFEKLVALLLAGVQGRTDGGRARGSEES